VSIVALKQSGCWMQISLSRIPLRNIGSALWVSKFTFAKRMTEFVS
jgi:hypothetical protein